MNNLVEKFIKIVALDVNELPIEFIEGYSTGGSINVDGKSAVRRSCQLNMISGSKFNPEYWMKNNKFKLYIGVRPVGEEITWYNQGLYVITSFNYSINGSSSTVNISGKDKMCMLNGEVAGHFGAPIRLDEEDIDGKKQKIPIPNLIREMVHSYGKEPFHNIVINDLDTGALELQEYIYIGTTLYLERKADELDYTQVSLSPPPEPEDGSKFIYDNRFEETNPNSTQVTRTIDGKEYRFCYAKVEPGETAGYREIGLIYPDELNASAAETVVSVLDKIKNIFGDFEYFYDVDGRFIFQKKKTYVNSSWTPVNTESGYVEPYVMSSEYAQEFIESPLFISFTKTPDVSNIKNDFIVIGSNKDNPNIVLRYSLHKKPVKYTSITVSDDELASYNEKHGFSIKGQTSEEYTIDRYDWRELIYRMAKDFTKFGHLDSFAVKVTQANPEFANGITGYEQYYTDMLGFWRDLYNPENADNSSELYGAPWTKLADDPSKQKYWLEFLECENTNLEVYSVSTFGIHSKVENDGAIKAISYKATPNIIFVENQDDEIKHTSYRKIQIGSYGGLFDRSAQGKTAKDTLDNLLYNYTFCAESLSAQMIPCYDLQPNTLIKIKDTKAEIDGVYIINSLSIPLTYNGNMTVNLMKKIDRLY